MIVTWLACDLLTGIVLAELPIAGATKLKRTLSTVEKETVTLPLADPALPLEWADLITQGRTMLAVCLDTYPIQGWVVDVPTYGAADVPIELSTLEACLDETNVPDLDATLLDEAETIALLMTPVVAGFGFTVAWDPVDRLADREYYESEDLSVLAAANALNERTGGPEWRITLAWADDQHRRLLKRIEIGPRIGEDRTDVIFDRSVGPDGLPHGTVETWTRTVRRSATRVRGVSDGSGDDRIMTPPADSPLIGQGWPAWEARVSPTGLGATDLAELEEADLVRLRDTRLAQAGGVTTWTLTTAPGAPVPGRDYTEGDTVYLEVSPTTYDPYGTQGRRLPVRVRGWELDTILGIATPVLWDPDNVTGAGRAGT